MMSCVLTSVGQGIANALTPCVAGRAIEVSKTRPGGAYPEMPLGDGGLDRELC